MQGPDTGCAGRRPLQGTYLAPTTPRSAGRCCCLRTLRGESVYRGVRKEPRKRQAAESGAGDLWRDHGLVFSREDGTALDRWQVRREFAVITKAAGLGEEWAPRELRHSFVSILSASGVPIERVSDLVGHSGTNVTETVYRHEIRPALTTGATAMNKILAAPNTTARNPTRNSKKYRAKSA